MSNWLTYKMKKGDTLAKIAARHKIGETRLQQINGITRRVRVGPGFTLLVPRPGSQANPDAIARALPKEGPAKSIKKKPAKKKAVNKKPPPNRSRKRSPASRRHRQNRPSRQGRTAVGYGFSPK